MSTLSAFHSVQKRYDNGDCVSATMTMGAVAAYLFEPEHGVVSVTIDVPHPILSCQPTVEQAAHWLTQIGTTPDGYIIIGPQGWHKLQEALDRERRHGNPQVVAD